MNDPLATGDKRHYIVVMDEGALQIARSAVDSWRYTQRNLRPFHLREREDDQVTAFLSLSSAIAEDAAVECMCAGVWPDHWPNVPNPEGLRNQMRVALAALRERGDQDGDCTCHRDDCWWCAGYVPRENDETVLIEKGDARPGCGCIMCRLRDTPKWRRWLYFHLPGNQKRNDKRFLSQGRGIA